MSAECLINKRKYCAVAQRTDFGARQSVSVAYIFCSLTVNKAFSLCKAQYPHV